MTDVLRKIIRQHCRPADPIPTGKTPILREISGLRAVLFDIYGTMLISASGDVGTAAEGESAEAFRDSLAAVGVDCLCGSREGVECLWETTRRHHAESRSRGVDFPEVDIIKVWEDVLEELGRQGRVRTGDAEVDFRQLAVQYEVRTNPVWPMPHLLECLGELVEGGLELGLISNAQFVTLELFPALVGKTVGELGFSEELQFYSFRCGHAKPGRYLFQCACEALSSIGIRADEVLYVGNDMLNDIQPSGELGFRTALFAGDERSLRLREGDRRVENVSPDLIITDLRVLGSCALKRSSPR